MKGLLYFQFTHSINDPLGGSSNWGREAFRGGGDRTAFHSKFVTRNTGNYLTIIQINFFIYPQLG